MENYFLRLINAKAEEKAFRTTAEWALEMAKELDPSDELTRSLKAKGITLEKVEESASKLDVVNEGADEAVKRELRLLIKRTSEYSETERLRVARGKGLFESDFFTPPSDATFKWSTKEFFIIAIYQFLAEINHEKNESVRSILLAYGDVLDPATVESIRRASETSSKRELWRFLNGGFVGLPWGTDLLASELKELVTPPITQMWE
ncbi:hypothetical protein QR680_010606 [Steinernema hermaphroditum]|uniref:Uncharacterized protein n=1 Tax=Steinernema hermaphroditum TaxID=289476 RepID=A0AA39MBV1_9BILA|nr:hypothetical protein QR680_010606 [Steinernema hermaphroditum]